MRRMAFLLPSFLFVVVVVVVRGVAVPVARLTSARGALTQPRGGEFTSN
jgi:hypothetical protein